MTCMRSRTAGWRWRHLRSYFTIYLETDQQNVIHSRRVMQAFCGLPAAYLLDSGSAWRLYDHRYTASPLESVTMLWQGRWQEAELHVRKKLGLLLPLSKPKEAHKCSARCCWLVVACLFKILWRVRRQALNAVNHFNLEWHDIFSGQVTVEVPKKSANRPPKRECEAKRRSILRTDSFLVFPYSQS